MWVVGAAAVALLPSCGWKKKKEEKPVITVPKKKPATTTPAYTRRNPNVNLASGYSGSAVTHSRGNTSLPYIALTFDDGPHPVHTPRLLDILAKHNVKATFYVVGSRVQQYPNIVRRMVAEGHEIGNHTWSHPNLTKLSPAAVRSELDRSRDAIAAIAGVKPRTMRPPYGALTQNQRGWIFGEYGYPTIMWSVDPRDWKDRNAGIVSSRIISQTGKGGIVLVHDIHGTSVSAMPSAINGLLAKGYQFVTVSQLLSTK